MTSLYVCPLSGLVEALATSNARTMITLAGPGKSIDQPSQIDCGFLALEFNDIDEPRDGLTEPKDENVRAIIEFAGSWDHQNPMILQCWMGVSRSTAAALIVNAACAPDQDMRVLAQNLRHLSPTATPNSLMITLADKQMGLGGSLVGGVLAIGRGAETFEGTPFTMELCS